jgi:hypothetical protein
MRDAKYEIINCLFLKRRTKNRNEMKQIFLVFEERAQRDDRRIKILCIHETDSKEIAQRDKA